MKKILTILAATATMFAFGAGNLDTTINHGADFEAEGFVPGANFIWGYNDSYTGATGDDRYWFTADTDAANIISNYTGSGTEVPIASRPEKFADVENSKYLQVETTGKLYRTVKNNGGSDDFTTNVTATYAHYLTDAPIYLDTLVKFTAADSVFGDDALENGDKIAIEYVEHESEGDGDPTVTNFVVRAGYVTGSGNSATVVQKNYFVDAPSGFSKDDWHRLTVRTISDVGDGTIGFVIYLDEVLLKYATEDAAGDSDFVDGLNQDVSSKFYSAEAGHALFPSVVRSGAAKTTISAVAFSGNGSLDDVVFTTTKPEFIQETALVTVRWDTNKITAVTLNSTGLTQAQWEVGEIAITPVDNSVEFSVTYAEGYKLGTCSVTPATSGGWDGANAFTNLKAGAVCDIGAIFPYFQVGNKYYENVADAIAAALVEEGANYGTLKLVADYAGDIELSDSGNIIIDLAGKTITGTEYGINNGAANLIITNSTAEIGHVTGGEGAVIIGGGTTTIYGGSFDAAIVIDSESYGLTLFGGKFLNCPEVLDDPSFYLNSFVDGSVTATAIANNYFQVGGGDTPQPTTYEITWTLTGGTTTATAGDFKENDTIVFTAETGKTLSYVSINGTEIADTIVYGASSYTYTVGTAAATLEVTFTTPATPTYAISWTLTGGTTEATAGDFKENDTIVFTAETGKTLSFVSIDGTEIADASVYGASSYTYTVGTAAAALVVTFTGSSYPSYIDDNIAYKDAYDTWKTDNNVAAGDNQYATAFLLNIAPDATDQTLEPVSITMEGGKVVISANQKLTAVNGKVYVKVATTLAGLATAEWTEATLDEGKVQVTPGSSDTAGFYKIKVDF
ncbi:MAG: hypothetical protein IKJ45_02250 [Kiritimatiellae bacterium]|nr:hypothetical protein [Kiritimatiellia bacterium]